MRIDQAWELSLKTWEDIIEGQRVGSQVHPARVGCEDCQSLSRPETVDSLQVATSGLNLLMLAARAPMLIFHEGVLLSTSRFYLKMLAHLPHEMCLSRWRIAAEPSMLARSILAASCT